MKINLKTCFAGLVAAALTGGAVADTKIRLRDGNNNFIVEQADGSTPPARQKVYGKGGVRIGGLTTVQRTALVLDTADAGTMVWDSDLKQILIWDGTSWIFYSIPKAYGEHVGDMEHDSNAEFTVTASTAPGVIECKGDGCTVKVAGTYRVLAQVIGSAGSWYNSWQFIDQTLYGGPTQTTAVGGWCTVSVTRNGVQLSSPTSEELHNMPYSYRYRESMVDSKRDYLSNQKIMQRLSIRFQPNYEVKDAGKWGISGDITRRHGSISNAFIDLDAGDKLGFSTWDVVINHGCKSVSMYIEGPLQ